MGNRVRGETDIVITSGDLAGTYVLLLDLNALCELEDDFPGIMDGTAEIKGVKSIRKIFHAGFQEHHSQLTELDVGRIIHAYGLKLSATKLGEAMKASFGEADKTTTSPRKGQASGGAGSEA